MALNQALALCVAVCASIVPFAQPSRTQPRRVNTDALLASINSVRVLAFETDRPVREVRALVDGKVVDTYRWPGTSKGIQLAVIRTGDVSVHMQVGNIGGILAFQFPMNIRAEVSEPESYGPGRYLELNDWVEVFSVKQVRFLTDVVASLRIEVR